MALAFAVQEISQSQAAIGLVLAAGILPLFGLVLVGGVWADRLQRQRIMLTADGVRAVVLATMAALLVSGVAEVWHLAALNALHGAAAAFFNPASTAFVPEVVDDAELHRANGLLGMTRSAAMIAGGALAGLLIDAVGAGAAIAIDGASFAISAACLLAMRPRSREAPAREPFLQEMAAGWDEVRSRSWVWMSILIFALLFLLYLAPFEVVGPIVSRRDYGGATVFGLTTAAIAVGVGLGNLLVVRWAIPSPVLISATLLMAMAVSPLLLAVVAPLWALLPFYFVEGVGVGLFMGTWTTALQRGIPEERLSRVSAWDWMGSLAGLPIGYVVAGFLVEQVGTDQVLYGMSACALLLAAWMMLAPAVRGIGSHVVAAHELPAALAGDPERDEIASTQATSGGATVALLVACGTVFTVLRVMWRRARRARRG